MPMTSKIIMIILLLVRYKISITFVKYEIKVKFTIASVK